MFCTSRILTPNFVDDLDELVTTYRPEENEPMTELTNEPAPTSSGGPPLANRKRGRKQDGKRKPVNVRKKFPETWLWTEEMVK